MAERDKIRTLDFHKRTVLTTAAALYGVTVDQIVEAGLEREQHTPEARAQADARHAAEEKTPHLRPGVSVHARPTRDAKPEDPVAAEAREKASAAAAARHIARHHPNLFVGLKWS